MYHWPLLGRRRHVFEEILNILKFCSHSHFVRPGVQEHAVDARMWLQEPEASHRLPMLHRRQRSVQYRAAQGRSRTGVAEAKSRFFCHDFIREGAVSTWEGDNSVSENAQRRQVLTFLLEHFAVAQSFTSLALTFPRHGAIEDRVLPAPVTRICTAPGSWPLTGSEATVSGGATGHRLCVQVLYAPSCRETKRVEALFAWESVCAVGCIPGMSEQLMFFCWCQRASIDRDAAMLISLVCAQQHSSVDGTGSWPGCIPGETAGTISNGLYIPGPQAGLQWIVSAERRARRLVRWQSREASQVPGSWAQRAALGTMGAGMQEHSSADISGLCGWSMIESEMSGAKASWR